MNNKDKRRILLQSYMKAIREFKEKKPPDKVPSVNMTVMSASMAKRMDASLPPLTYHLNFDGVNDKITIPAAASINNLPLGDFTVDFSILGLSLATTSGYLIQKSDGDFIGWEVYFSSDGNNAYLSLYVVYDNWDAAIIQSLHLTDFDSHTYEIDFEASNKSVKIFVDGVDTILQDDGYGTPNAYADDSASDIAVGGHPTVAADTALQFSCRWLRISNIARHTSNFTPPDLYVCPDTDANTVLRLALDEGGGTVANDTSGNFNNGTIDGPLWELDE